MFKLIHSIIRVTSRGQQVVNKMTQSQEDNIPIYTCIVIFIHLISIYPFKGTTESKVYPRTGHEVPDGE
jgi:hypothetical protein